MQRKRIFTIAFFINFMAVAGACSVYADCPYDHFLVGQDNGALFLDTTQLYRHWNADWGTNSDPYGQEYYEFSEMFGGGYIRVEPGFGENTNPAYALEGTRGEDYNIIVELVSTTEGLTFYDDLNNPILASAGDTFCLSDYENHHVHVRYYLSAGMDPTQCYTVSYRLSDSTGTYAASAVYTFHLGAVPEPASLLLLAAGGLVILHRQRKRSKFSPDSAGNFHFGS